ncbi:hypothetical protein [Reyranella sp.]|nr:hypothetical protein [Reyranella sp.]
MRRAREETATIEPLEWSHPFRLLEVIDRLPLGSNGGFFDHRGDPVPW